MGCLARDGLTRERGEAAVGPPRHPWLGEHCWELRQPLRLCSSAARQAHGKVSFKFSPGTWQELPLCPSPNSSSSAWDALKYHTKAIFTVKRQEPQELSLKSPTKRLLWKRINMLLLQNENWRGCERRWQKQKPQGSAQTGCSSCSCPQALPRCQAAPRAGTRSCVQ